MPLMREELEVLEYRQPLSALNWFVNRECELQLELLLLGTHVVIELILAQLQRHAVAVDEVEAVHEAEPTESECRQGRREMTQLFQRLIRACRIQVIIWDDVHDPRRSCHCSLPITREA